MATGVGRVGSPLGGANPKITCCDPSGKRLPPRASAILPGLAGRLGLRLGTPEPASLTFSTETPKVGEVRRRDPGGMGGSGVFSDPWPGGDGLRRCRSSGSSTAPGPSPHSGWSPAFQVLRVPRGGRPRVLPTPFPGGGALLCVCAPSPGRPGLSRVASCGDPLSDRVARVPSTLLLCGPSCSSPVHICLWCGLRTCLYMGSWTRPAYSCLSSKVCARLGGAFSVAPREQFLKSVTRKDQLQLFQ